MASKKRIQSSSGLQQDPQSGSFQASNKIKDQEELDHLHTIFQSIDRSVVEMVYDESGYDFNAALERLLFMTGDSDPNVRTPWQLDHAKPQGSGKEQEFPGLTNGSPHRACDRPAGRTVPSSSSGQWGWSAALSANGSAFAPTQAKNSGRSGNEVRIELDQELAHKLKLLQHPNVKLMILMRGLPGSGKTSLANHISVHYEGHCVSADEYFMKSGYYHFDPNLLGYAHEWAQKRADDWARINSKLIIVDNTHLEDWEMMPYAAIADRHGYRLVLAEPKTAWKYTPSTLAKRNSHGVRQEAIERSLARFDRSVTAEDLVQRVRAKGDAFSKLATLTPQRRTTPVPPPQPPAQHDVASKPKPVPFVNSAAIFSLRDESPAEVSDPMDTSPPVSVEELGLAGKCDEDDRVRVGVRGRTIRERIKAAAEVCADEACNWGMPAFPVRMEVQNSAISEEIICRDSSSQTVEHHFAELELGEELIFLGDDFDEDNEDEGPQSRQTLGEEYVRRRKRAAPVLRDKGTSISSEELGDLSEDQKVAKLREQFPQATTHHIREVLKACQHNHQYAAAILMGFEDDHFEDLVMSDSSDEAAEEEESGEDREPGLELELDVGLAAALEAKFGPIPGEAFGSLRFSLTQDLARNIYDAWRQATTGQAVAGASSQPVPAATPKKNKAKQPNGLFLSAPKGTLQEIMQFEEALNRSKQDRQAHAQQSKELMYQLAQRKLLYEKFPGASEEALDTLFEVNNYDLVETIIGIKQSTYNSRYSNDVQYLNALQSTSKNLVFPPKSDGGRNELRIPLNVPPSKAMMAKTLPQLREEMLALYQLKRQYLNKARDCCSRKQYMVTTYYRQEANDVERRIEKLAQAIVIKSLEVQGAGNVLDLHFLHVREALCVLKCFLELKRKELKNSTHKVTFVEVITGYGAGGTVPRIKPEVEKYLRAKNFVFTAKNEGCYMVTLRAGK